MKKILSILVLIIFVLSLSSCSKTEDINNQIDNNITEGQQEQKDAKTDDNKKLDLKETKEVLITIEGMEEKEIFKLADNGKLPFITYVPEDCKVFYNKNKVVINWRDFGFLEIEFFEDFTDEAEIVARFEDITKEYSQVELVEDESFNKAYSVRDLKDREVIKSGNAWLREYNNGVFLVHWHLDNMEAGDGFGPRLNAIFKEWVWKDTGENLEEPYFL